MRVINPRKLIAPGIILGVLMIAAVVPLGPISEVASALIWATLTVLAIVFVVVFVVVIGGPIYLAIKALTKALAPSAVPIVAAAGTSATSSATTTTTSSSKKQSKWLRNTGRVAFVLVIVVIALFVGVKLWTWIDDFTSKNMPALRSDGRPPTGMLANYDQLILKGEGNSWMVSFTTLLEPLEFTNAIMKRGPYKKYNISPASFVSREGVSVRVFTEAGAVDLQTGHSVMDIILEGTCKSPLIRDEGAPPRTLCEGLWRFSGNSRSGRFEISHNGRRGTAQLYIEYAPRQWSEIISFTFYSKPEALKMQ